MKKLSVALLIAAALFVMVSCSTTQASDVEPVVREVKISDFTAKTYPADKVYAMIERFVKDTYEGDRGITIVKEPEAKTITIKGFELDANVGALAQDGYIEMDMKFEAKDDLAVISLIFIDSYTFIHIGPITKKSSQGITELGLRELDYQAKYVADTFQAGLSTYAYYIDQGLI